MRGWHFRETRGSHGPIFWDECRYMRVLAPESCTTMGEVRAGVDSLDSRILDLLGERFAYMAAAARIKPDRDMVRDEARKAVVVAQAARQAEELGMPVATIEKIWEILVEASIAFEMVRFEEECVGSASS